MSFNANRIDEDLGKMKNETQGPDGGKSETRPLPEIRRGDWIQANPPTLPPELIQGIIHQGCKMALGGGSKTYKTWSLIDIALSVTNGVPWWNFETQKGTVAYLNFEVPEAFFHHRIHAVAAAKGIPIPKNLLVWNLRGFAMSHDKILPALSRQLTNEELLALIIDPTYKLMGRGDENSTTDMALMLNDFEKLAVDTGAAVLFGAHFSKGNQAGKEPMDRISGAGVFGRDPDAIMTMTKHEQDGAFAIDSILRNCPPLDSFCVQWNHPLMIRTDLDPSELKEIKPRTGRPAVAEVLDIIAELPTDQGWRTKQWQQHCRAELGLPERSFYALFKDAKENYPTRIHQRADSTWVRLS